ncbi:MAG TPA: hypothetical protein VHL78_07850 [Actinomycetota bacterium]|nr:hypothetical protein [Actinomycetota bacterium]
MVGSAYLRVFQPLDALPENERAGWERYIVHGGHLKPVRRVYRERHTGHRGRLGLLTAEEDRADVRLVGGRWYVCPWRTPLRVLASLLALRDMVPEEVADALVPESEARRVARELARIRRRDPSAVPSMLESHWHVPVRWFVLFSGKERRIEERADGGFRLSYWTTLARARERAGRAVRVLKGGDLDDVVSIVEDLDEWLSRFARPSAVELDYGGLSDHFGWNELEEDRSAEEIQAALDALEAGDNERAAELYQAVAGRWAEARIRESLN